MAQIKYFIGKDANSLYEEIGKERAEELEQFDFNTKDEIIDYFCVMNNFSKIDFVLILQYWQDETRIETIQKNLKQTIKEIHFDFTDKLKKGNSNICRLTSNTDVLCKGSDFRLSVEGKFKEFRKLGQSQMYFYPTIKNMKVGIHSIIQKIEDDWIEAIQEFCNPDITRIDDMQFQFLLRLVDACISSPAKAIVLYQFFCEDDSTTNKWIEALTEWKSIINPKERLSFFAQVIHVEGIDNNSSLHELFERTRKESFIEFREERLIQI